MCTFVCGSDIRLISSWRASTHSGTAAGDRAAGPELPQWVRRRETARRARRGRSSSGVAPPPRGCAARAHGVLQRRRAALGRNAASRVHAAATGCASARPDSSLRRARPRERRLKRHRRNGSVRAAVESLWGARVRVQRRLDGSHVSAVNVNTQRLHRASCIRGSRVLAATPAHPTSIHPIAMHTCMVCGRDDWTTLQGFFIHLGRSPECKAVYVERNAAGQR